MQFVCGVKKIEMSPAKHYYLTAAIILGIELLVLYSGVRTYLEAPTSSRLASS